MENEAYTLAYHMAWVFFPCFLLIAMLQLILFCLFNHKYHPFVDLLDDTDNQGMQVEENPKRKKKLAAQLLVTQSTLFTYVGTLKFPYMSFLFLFFFL